MKVQVYAILKEYFDKEFEVEGSFSSVSELKRRLQQSHPAAAGTLAACRFAVNDEFIDDNFQLKEHDIISIIPPGSGG